MGVILFQSTDASAPVLDGTAGSLVNLLDKCLVAGYGVGAQAAGAGWTKPFTAANKAVFKMGGGIQMYLDVDDSGPGAATTQEARIRGYEVMTAVATGTGSFPTAAQVAGFNARKSAAATATTRSWILIADDRCFYFMALTEGTAAYWGFSFGEHYSLGGSGDAYRCLIIGRLTENSVLASVDSFGSALYPPGGAIGGHYTPRDSTGLGGSRSVTKMGGLMGGAVSTSGGYIGANASSPLPNPVDGKLYFSPLIVGDFNGGGIRGRLRGAYEPEFKNTSFSNLDTVAGEGVLAGRTLLLVKNMAINNSAAIAFDVTGPWETN